MGTTQANGRLLRSSTRRTRRCHGTGGIGLGVFVGGCLLLGTIVRAAEPWEAVIVRFDTQLRPTVTRLQKENVRLAPGESGLVVWLEEGHERWQVFREKWSRPPVPERGRQEWLVTDALSSRGGATSSPVGIGQLTTQLDPLLSPSVIKALQAPRQTQFITPPDGGIVLGPRLTIRRAATPGTPLPAVTIVLAGGGESLRISLQENQATWSLSEVAQLPVAWKHGLPAGAYTLRVEADSRPAVTFTVESSSRREQVLKWLEEWLRLAGGRSKALDALVAVEYLAANQPLPYLADALDILDDLPRDSVSSCLQRRRQEIVELLGTGNEPASPSLGDEPTGIPEIDQARSSIARGRWNEATSRLDRTADSTEARAGALADLYRGVIHAESGLGQEPAANFYFRRAITGLQTGSAADRFRAHNNFANFLLNRAQDRLFNHAFQMAAGASQLFLTALASWEEARSHYAAAGELAGALGLSQQASVEVNQARLYATLADLIATLDAAEPRATIGSR